MSRLCRTASALALFAGVWLAPTASRAETDAPSVVASGFDGFWTGAQIGLASGYLATGSEFESDEWRKLAFGTAVGALVGVGTGITLGIVDVGGGPPHTGHIILRDVGYGVGLGGLVGLTVGALFLIDDGRPKHLLTGAAVGTLAGAGAGLVFGLIEAAAARPEPVTTADISGLRSMRFTLVGSESSWLPMPALEGRF